MILRSFCIHFKELKQKKYKKIAQSQVLELGLASYLFDLIKKIFLPKLPQITQICSVI